jgi:hypothetical protein
MLNSKKNKAVYKIELAILSLDGRAFFFEHLKKGTLNIIEVTSIF